MVGRGEYGCMCTHLPYVHTYVWEMCVHGSNGGVWLHVDTSPIHTYLPYVPYVTYVRTYVHTYDHKYTMLCMY